MAILFDSTEDISSSILKHVFYLVEKAKGPKINIEAAFPVHTSYSGLYEIPDEVAYGSLIMTQLDPESKLIKPTDVYSQLARSFPMITIADLNNWYKPSLSNNSFVIGQDDIYAEFDEDQDDVPEDTFDVQDIMDEMFEDEEVDYPIFSYFSTTNKLDSDGLSFLHSQGVAIEPGIESKDFTVMDVYHNIYQRITEQFAPFTNQSVSKDWSEQIASIANETNKKLVTDYGIFDLTKIPAHIVLLVVPLAICNLTYLTALDNIGSDYDDNLRNNLLTLHKETLRITQNQ